MQSIYDRKCFELHVIVDAKYQHYYLKLDKFKLDGAEEPTINIFYKIKKGNFKYAGCSFGVAKPHQYPFIKVILIVHRIYGNGQV